MGHYGMMDLPDVKKRMIYSLSSFVGPKTLTRIQLIESLDIIQPWERPVCPHSLTADHNNESAAYLVCKKCVVLLLFYIVTCFCNKEAPAIGTKRICPAPDHIPRLLNRTCLLSANLQFLQAKCPVMALFYFIVFIAYNGMPHHFIVLTGGGRRCHTTTNLCLGPKEPI